MADSGIDLEAELDRIFALPLAEFVGARNAFSARLKAAGDRDGAARVKALAKPNVAAWAVNQVRFSAPDVFAALLAASDQLRSGTADIREAMLARRGALAAAKREAEALLEAAGHGAAPQTMQRVSSTLEALATYGDAPGRPIGGRLTEDLPAPGFEEIAALGFLPAAAPPVSPPARVEPVPATPAKVTRADHGRELQVARDLAERASRTLAARKREAEEARKSLAAVETKAEAATRERQKAEAELAEAVREERRHEEAVQAARERAHAAESASRDAAAAAEEADAALERLARLERRGTAP